MGKWDDDRQRPTSFVPRSQQESTAPGSFPRGPQFPQPTTSRQPPPVRHSKVYHKSHSEEEFSSEGEFPLDVSKSDDPLYQRFTPRGPARENYDVLTKQLARSPESHHQNIQQAQLIPANRYTTNRASTVPPRRSNPAKYSPVNTSSGTSLSQGSPSSSIPSVAPDTSHRSHHASRNPPRGEAQQSHPTSASYHTSGTTSYSPGPSTAPVYRDSTSPGLFSLGSMSRALPTLDERDWIQTSIDQAVGTLTSPTLKLHWQLLPYDQTPSKRFIYFDVTFPIHDIEYRQNSLHGIQRIPLSDTDLDKPAADTQLTEMTIKSHCNPFEWGINVKHSEGICVRDVFEAIYAAFQVPLTSDEKNLIPHDRRATYEEALRLRCKLAAEPMVERSEVLKRVDTLLHETFFHGLTRSKSGGYWELDVRGTIPANGKNWENLRRDAPIVPSKRDPETNVSNSPSTLSHSHAEQEYPPLYPGHSPDALPKDSYIHLFNLPLSAVFAASTDVDNDLTSPSCRICRFARLSTVLPHRTLYTLMHSIPPLIPDSTSQDYTWAFFCRFVPLGCLFDSPARGPLPTTQLGSGRAGLVEKFELQLENPTNTVTWLHGPPGTGKSVIAYTLASRCRQKHRLAGSFFFSRRQGNCGSAHSVVLALAYQLGLSESLAKEKIITALSSDPGLIFPSRDLREQFARLLIEPLEAVDRYPPSRAFIIDAVDQCRDQILDLISLLTRLLSHFTGVGFHIFFTSRDEVLIKRNLAVVTSVTGLGHMDIDPDIFLFLRQSFKKICTRHRLRCHEPWPRDEVLNCLVDRVGPYFDAASVVIKFIESPDHDPTDRMDLIYHVLINPSLHPGSSVDDFYESIISTSDDIKQAYLHLTIVVSLAGVLSYSQLDNLLNRGTNQKFDMCSVLSQLPSLVHIPAGYDGAVQVCHESLRDFLCDPLRSGEQFISQALVHRLLAYSCLSIMVKEVPDDSTISSRLCQLMTDSTSLDTFDDESVLLLAAYSPPDPLQLLSTLWHIMQHRITGLTADSRTNLALGYFCSTWQILQHLELSTFDTLLPAFRFLENIRALPVLLAFPIFLSFESPGNDRTPDPSILQYKPRIEALNMVAELVNNVYAFKERCRTDSGALDYACIHWAYHLSMAEWDDDLRSILTTFMGQKLQQWLVKAWCLQDFETCLRTLYKVWQLCLTAELPLCFNPDATRTDTNTEAKGVEEPEADVQLTSAIMGGPSRPVKAEKNRADKAVAEVGLVKEVVKSYATAASLKEDAEIPSSGSSDLSSVAHWQMLCNSLERLSAIKDPISSRQHIVFYESDIPSTPSTSTTQSYGSSLPSSGPITPPQLPMRLGSITPPQLPMCLGSITPPQLPMPLGSITSPQVPIPLGPITPPQLPMPLGPITPPQLPAPLGPITPPQLPTPLGPVAIHPLLAYHPYVFPIHYDVSSMPNTASVNASAPPILLDSYHRADPATAPAITVLSLRSDHLPWLCEIRASTCPYITVEDVLSQLYRFLRIPGTRDEYKLAPSQYVRDKIAESYRSRCSRASSPEGYAEELSKGLKRVDFLMGRTTFMGLSSTKLGPDYWVLNLQ